MDPIYFSKYKNLSSAQYSLDDFVQHKFVGCSEDNIIGAEYDSMIFAEIGCSSNVECIGILDARCMTDLGPFRLCKNGSISPSSACLHQKKQYSGTCIHIIII